MDLKVALKNYTYVSNSLLDTQKLAESLAKNAFSSDVFSLTGDLGSGKTAFCKYFLQFLLIKQEHILSPTFPIIKSYASKHLGEIYHMDLYRINSEDELLELGVDEILNNHCCLVEWGDLLGRFAKKDTIKINIEYTAHKRIFTIECNLEQYQRLIIASGLADA